jgi:hypothetical protein
MANLTVREAQGLFTKFLVDVYRERPQTTSFLRSFFPSKVTNSLNVSIEVQRGTEKIAVDVIRGADGNRNSISKSTEKIFQPPYYNEYFDMTQLDLYNRLWNSNEIDAGMFRDYTEQVADHVQMVRDKIERAYELQCAQVLQTGIVELNAGTNIDFSRRAGSLVSAPVWTNNANDPADTFINAGNFLRQTGKVQGATINCIMSETAFAAFVGNTLVQTRAWVRNFHLDNIMAPQRNSTGATYMGRYAAGSYNFDLWTYPEFYDNASGVSTPYITPGNVIWVPQQTKFTLAFGAVPRLMNDGGIAAATGMYVMNQYTDPRKTAHIMDVKSAGIAIPVAVDQIYTASVV